LLISLKVQDMIAGVLKVLLKQLINLLRCKELYRLK